MKIEFWLTLDGEIRMTEQNPCGCHPFDFIIHLGPRWFDAKSHGFKSRRRFRAYVNRLGWEKLP